jgi:hypothetical protein
VSPGKCSHLPGSYKPKGGHWQAGGLQRGKRAWPWGCAAAGRGSYPACWHSMRSARTRWVGRSRKRWATEGRLRSSAHATARAEARTREEPGSTTAFRRGCRNRGGCTSRHTPPVCGFGGVIKRTFSLRVHE